jgi:hypothetical protein
VRFRHDIHVVEVRGKLGKEVGDLLEEQIKMSIKLWHCLFVGGVPIIQVRVVEEGNKLEKDLVIKRLRLMTITINDGRDDHIAIDAEAIEVKHVDHCSNPSNGNVCF